jgi:hypothetical protein
MATTKSSMREEEQWENTGLRSRDNSPTSASFKKTQNLELSSEVKEKKRGLLRYFQGMNSMKMIVLVVLCLQNSLFTVLRRYSQGVLREVYSKVSLRSNKQSKLTRICFFTDPSMNSTKFFWWER